MEKTRMIKMNEEDFEPYMKKMVREYADEKQKAGTWPADEALKKAQEEIKRLLPDGYQTPGHYFLTLLNSSGEKIGLFWLNYALNEPSRRAFIYDFEIFEPYRNGGFGQSALDGLFEYCKTASLKEIRLHVFAHNDRAIHVYRKLGFRATDMMMTKQL
ncbi:GNAT family N-acetyltransferase [Sporolactobacillus pectinivorans]|uniref:GNAT family N-acetyltransferase n=1 Tax=Sporolactobacillus pectinivorans TaxID=1591408 RepID=UPI0012FE558F|nr:GNAT family N-acetyltransferase [Sporolactobacillus pectinivorans]